MTDDDCLNDQLNKIDEATMCDEICYAEISTMTDHGYVSDKQQSEPRMEKPSI